MTRSSGGLSGADREGLLGYTLFAAFFLLACVLGHKERRYETIPNFV